MYYIRVSQYGQIAWGTMGWTNHLKLNRYKPNGTGLCSVLELESYEDAVNYCNDKNKFNDKTTYHVEDFNNPFVQNWLAENSLNYTVNNNRIEVISQN